MSLLATGVAMACGDDDGSGELEPDAGHPDAGIDGSAPDTDTSVTVRIYLDPHDCEGIPDQDAMPDWCGRFTYNANGNLLSWEQDLDCDGIPDLCEQRTHDDLGNVVDLKIESGGCDGTPDRCDQWTRDAHGRLTSHEFDDHCDGTPDRCEEWIYDAKEDRISHLTDGAMVIGGDTPCDGIPGAWAQWMYDANGNLIEVQSGADEGTPTGCEWWTYDADGNQTGHEQGRECYGTAEQCEHWTYDASGEPITYEQDMDCDGTLDRCVHWTHEESPNRVTECVDFGCDGIESDRGSSDGCERRTHDAAGNWTKSEHGFEPDGPWDRCSWATYAWDGNLRVLIENPPALPNPIDESLRTP